MNQLDSLNDQRLPDGDLAFHGVDMRIDPQQLSPGFCASAVNARFRFGRAEPRLGVMPLRFNFSNAFEWDAEWDKGDINWNIPIAIGTVYGIGVWEDPNGSQWQLFAAARSDGATRIKIWAGKQGNRVREVHTSVIVDIPTDSTFPQDSQTSIDRFWFTSAFNKCFMHRGTDGSVLVMEDIDEGFKDATTTSSTDPDVFSIPNSKSSIYFQNRLAVPYKPTGTAKADSVAISDILSFTDFSIFNSFRINQGDSDDVVLLRKFNDNSVVVFKESAIYSINNLVGDWGTNAFLDDITSEYGLIGRNSVVDVGRDLWFLSQRGVTSLIRTQDNKMQGTDQPMSTPIQPLIDRINWYAAQTTASAGYFKDRYYLSIPTDASYKNNMVLVYDFLNKAWCGYDDTEVKYFFVADNNGSDALHYIDDEGRIGLYEYSEEDGSILGAQDNYCVDITLAAHPANDSEITVIGGDTITATRERDWVDDTGSEVLEDDGTVTIETLEKNIDAGGKKHWGIGHEYSEPCSSFPAQNLFLGFSTSDSDYTKWDSGGAAVTELACGVRLCNTSPMIVSTNDPYIAITNTAETAIVSTPINFEITTRAYGYAGGTQGRWRQGQIHVSTWDPSYTVTVITDGAYEESAWVDEQGTIKYITKDRTKYLGFAVEDWPITNANKDFRTPGREDYSIVMDSNEAAGGTCFDVGGMEMMQYQFWTNKFLSNRRGAYYQIKINNTQGRIRVHAVGAVKLPGETKLAQHGGLH